MIRICLFMNSKDLIKKYIEFFKKKEHTQIGGGSLIPENDPSALFITAGMHSLVPFLIGRNHPAGRRLVNVQNCLRTGDIDEIGDSTHLTFFRMLGNWSLGDYWKKEAIEMSFDFLTKILKFDKNKISVSCFKGDKDVPKDTESAMFWENLGIPKDRIYFFGKKDNWWGPVGKTGPCGPDTEIFIDTGKEKCNPKCNPSCSCGKYFEIWNNVFMQYHKNKDGKYTELEQKNIDTGMGVERTIAMLNGFDDVYKVDGIKEIYSFVSKLAKRGNVNSLRIIVDHLIASCYIMQEEIAPSNLDQGYVLRRLIRRAIRHGRLIGLNNFCFSVASEIIKVRKLNNKHFILEQISLEEKKFLQTLEKGLHKFEKMKIDKKIDGLEAFKLFSTYGFPLEMIKELCVEKKIKIDEKGFVKEFEKHQELSRKGAKKRFRGGLSDAGVETTKLHTATHLLHQALIDVLGHHIQQKGSNITPERLRFDFSHDKKLSPEELEKVENRVNEVINSNLEIKKEKMKVSEAKKKGAIGLFDSRYGDKVFVYSIGNYSKEICMGPHVSNTKELGKFKIIKEQGVASGVRRIKAILE